MTVVEWDESLRIGVPSIDDDHKNIILWINDIHGMADYNFPHRTLVYVLDCFVDYVENHFRREERAMEAVNYKGIDAHKRAHQKFEEYIGNVHALVMADRNSVVSAEVMDFIVNWLSDHIANVDALMAPFINGDKDAILASELVASNVFRLPKLT